MKKTISLTKEDLEEMTQVFHEIDLDKSGTINIAELGTALSRVGIRLSAYEIRELIRQIDTAINADRIDFEDFKSIYASQKDKHNLGHKWKDLITARSGLDTYVGMSNKSSQDTTHTVKKEEEVAFPTGSIETFTMTRTVRSISR
jgi:plastin-3